MIKFTAKVSPDEYLMILFIKLIKSLAHLKIILKLGEEHKIAILRDL